MKKVFTLISFCIASMLAMAADFTLEHTQFAPSGTWWTADKYIPLTDLAAAAGYDSVDELKEWIDSQDGIISLIGEDKAYSADGCGYWLDNDGNHTGWNGSQTWYCCCPGYDDDDNPTALYIYMGVNAYLTWVGGESMHCTLYLNAKKTVVIDVKQSFKVAPSLALSLMQQSGEAINLPIEQYPAHKSNTVYYGIPVSSTALGTLGLEAEGDGSLYHAFIKQYDENGMISDILYFINGDTYLQPIYDDNGDPTSTLVLGGTSEDRLYITDFSIYEDTLWFGLGQEVDVNQVGDKYDFSIYISSVDEKSYALINVNFTAIENSIKTLYDKSQMTKVGEETMTYTRGIDDCWDVVTYHYIDKEKVASLFGEGVNIGDLIFACLKDDDNTFYDDYSSTNSGEYGFWMYLDSHPGASWSADPAYYVLSQYLVSDGCFTIGQAPGTNFSAQAGWQTSGSVYLIYSDKYYEIHSNITIGEGDPSANVIGEYDFAMPVSGDVASEEVPNLADAYAALGCTEEEFENAGQIMAGISVGSNTFTAEGFNETEDAYEFDADGNWVDPSAADAGDKTKFFLYLSDGEFNATTVDAITEDQVFKADIALCYNGNYYVYHITLTHPTGISSIQSGHAMAGKIYNLAGQQVGAGYKGIVIQGGKKVIR